MASMHRKVKSLNRINGAGHDALFRAKRLLLGPLRVRRAHVYGVGIAKSGTRSLGRMFSGNVRAAHEPRVLPLIDKFFDWHGGRVSEPEMSAWLRARDREMALEVDSSWLNVLMLDLLLREFPEARFILTIRDCYSWLNSTLNHSVRFRKVSPAQRVKARDFVFRRGGFVHAPEERILREGGFYTLDGYFSGWAAHNGQVLARVPPERLLVVRTDQIRHRAGEIADFAGLPRRAIRLQRTHEFQNPDKKDMLRKLDRDFLERKVEQRCRPLMTQFFPEIKSLDDARL